MARQTDLELLTRLGAGRPKPRAATGVRNANSRRSQRALFGIAIWCFGVLLPAASPARAQKASDVQYLAQAVAQRRAQPIPNKLESEEAAKERINNWTVGLAGGLLEGTFVRYAADLAKALDDGDNLRVLPIISYGAVGNVTDLLYLKGVDIAITYSDVLDHFKNVAQIPGIERRVNFIIPMFQGEVHIYARPEIKTLQDLAGKKVNFNTVGSAANYTGGIIFDRLDIKVERIFQNNSTALEGMRKGEISALVHVVGKPNDLFAKFKPEPGFHFLPLEFTDKFSDYYFPAELTAADYPNLIQSGENIQTVSVPALLAVYNWRTDNDRYRRCVRFVEYLFDRFEKLKGATYQPGWKEINLAGNIPGWTRFPPAQEVLDKLTTRTQAARAVPKKSAEQDRSLQQVPDSDKPTHVSIELLQIFKEAGGKGTTVQQLAPFTTVKLVKSEQGWVLIAKDGKLLGYVAEAKLRRLN
jgi:TRAP-type uncharacterized transport system substrate-binding protein